MKSYPEIAQIVASSLGQTLAQIPTGTVLEGEDMPVEEFQLRMHMFVSQFGRYMKDLQRVENNIFEFDEVGWIEQFLCTLEDKPEMLTQEYKPASRVLQPEPDSSWAVTMKPHRPL